MEDSEEKRRALFRESAAAYHRRYAGRFLGPHNILMRFSNFNPRKDPRIDASQYEDSFLDVGRKEMERRFSARRELFLDIYDPAQPRQSLHRYMKTAQVKEGYIYRSKTQSGPASVYLGGSVSKKHSGKGELPECQLLGFVDGKGKVGCMAHPLAATSCGYDGRDRVGFFRHTGCCENVGCEASREFRFLSASALKVFDEAVAGMSWYEYSRHAMSVLVYYLRGYDYLLQKLDEIRLLDTLTLEQLVEFTNTLYDTWLLRSPNGDSEMMSSLNILCTDIPLTERILYIALRTRFLQNRFGEQLQQARNSVQQSLESISA